MARKPFNIRGGTKEWLQVYAKTVALAYPFLLAYLFLISNLSLETAALAAVIDIVGVGIIFLALGNHR